MESLTVAEVAAALDVSEESVRRWVRDGKLKADRKLGRTGHTIYLEDLVQFVNQPPCNYFDKMKAWLDQHEIAYTIKKYRKGPGATLAGAAMGGVMAGVLGAVAGGVAGFIGYGQQEICLTEIVDAEAVSEVKSASAVALPAAPEVEVKIIEEQPEPIELQANAAPMRLTPEEHLAIIRETETHLQRLIDRKQYICHMEERIRKAQESITAAYKEIEDAENEIRRAAEEMKRTEQEIECCNSRLRF